MKKLLFLTMLTFFCFALQFAIPGCIDETVVELSESIDFTHAVNEYNKPIPEHSPEHRAIIIPGDIRIAQYVEAENEERKLVLFVTGEDIYRKYQFQYKMDAGKIDLPEAIANGRTIYLGDNLVVQDIQNGKNYLFIVEGFENRIPELKPTIHGIGITSVIFDNEESLANATGTCSCSCKQCSFCDWNCGTASASCSCGGSSQSSTCRDCYNAECTLCDDPIK